MLLCEDFGGYYFLLGGGGGVLVSILSSIMIVNPPCGGRGLWGSKVQGPSKQTAGMKHRNYKGP